MIRKSSPSNKTSVPATQIGLDRSTLYFFSVLIIFLSFAVGYLFGKSKNPAVSTENTKAANPQAAQQPQQPGQPQISMETIKGLFSKNVIKFGKGDKKLVLVEVSDPSCPFCHIAAGANTEIGAQVGDRFKLVSQGGTYLAPVPEMKKLVDQGKADFVWIYTSGHGNGEMGTKALYCAYDQGKFWQAHDLLMSAKGYDLLNNQVKNDKTKSQVVADFLAAAVNSKDLKGCLDSGKYDARLSEESALASSLGVSGTPGFFLNTTNFAGAYSWNDMKSVADAALK